jgi:hypothetical protein
MGYDGRLRKDWSAPSFASTWVRFVTEKSGKRGQIVDFPSAPEQNSGSRKPRVFAKYNRLEQRSQGLARSVQSRFDGSGADA